MNGLREYEVEVTVTCPKASDEVSKRVVDIVAAALGFEKNAVARAEEKLRETIATMVSAGVPAERARCLGSVDDAVRAMFANLRAERRSQIRSEDISNLVADIKRRIAEGT